MNTTARRAREFLEREQLFLQTARNIIRDSGLHALTMEKIAAETEYAKGTIYKHFANKEDLVLSLCSQALSYMVAVCEEMDHFPGSPREKLAIVAAAYQAYSESFPEEFDLIMETRSGNLREKASEQRLERLDEVDNELLDLIRHQINRAVEIGDLTIAENQTPDDICFGLWSLSFGVSVLSQASDLTRNLTLGDNRHQLFTQLSCLLDGYQWRPFTQDLDYTTVLENAEKHVLNALNKSYSLNTMD